MSHRIKGGIETLVSTEDVDGLFFLWRGNARAPMRRLWPFTIFVSVLIGLAVGLAVGVPSGLLGYYLFKEGLNGLIGGLFAPLFLWLGRRAYARWHRQSGEPRPVGNLMYSMSGALAGSLMIPMQCLLPPIIPLGPWLIFYPLSTAALFPFIAAMVDYVELQKEEHSRTKELFGKYVSETVARRILEERNHVNFSGEKRRCTVLFSDIRGFTRMVKELGPEQVVHTLNEYFATMIDIIFQFDGTINKFIGDAVVVLYGAPVALGDEALRAVKTAQQMHLALRDMNAARAAIGKPPIHIGIGIDTGDVVVGNVGSPRRLEYTAIGAPVNNANYLGTIAPADVVYISENAYREIAGQVPVKPWQRVQLKAGTGEVMVYTFEPYAEERGL
jgi:class 3 adenylate cyclase